MPRGTTRRKIHSTPLSPGNPQPTAQPSSQTTVVLIGGIILLLFLVYTIIPVVSPFLILGAILFLLYPLRHQALTRTVMWLAVLLFLIWFLYSLAWILAPFLVAFLIAYLLDPVVNRMQDWNVPRWASSLLLMVVFLGLVALAIIFVMPAAFRQFEGIIEGVSIIVNDVVEIVRSAPLFAGLERFGFPRERIEQLLAEDLTPRLEVVMKGLLEGAFDLISSASAVLTHIINIIIIPFLAFYIMKDFPVIIDRFRKFIPGRRQERVIAYFRRVDRLFGRYLRGAIAVAIIYGTLVSLLLTLFGIRYPLVLGVISGVMTIIPYFGFFVSLALSLLVALFSGDPVLTKVLFVLFTFGVAQIVEFAILQPNILGRQVGMHPVLLVLSLLVFGFFLGFIGLLIAVPTTAIVIMTFKESEERRAAVPAPAAEQSPG